MPLCCLGRRIKFRSFLNNIFREVSVYVFYIPCYFFSHLLEVLYQELLILELKFVFFVLRQYRFFLSFLYGIFEDRFEFFCYLGQIIENIYDLSILVSSCWSLYLFSLDHTLRDVLLVYLLLLIFFCPPHIAFHGHILIVLLLLFEKLLYFVVLINKLHWDHGPLLAHILDHCLEIRHVYMFGLFCSCNIFLSLFYGFPHFLESFDVVDQPEVSLRTYVKNSNQYLHRAAIQGLPLTGSAKSPQSLVRCIQFQFLSRP